MTNEISTGYGERPWRVVILSLIIISTFSLFYWLSGGIAYTTGSAIRFIDYLLYSLAAFSTIGFPDLVPINDSAKFLTSVEALFGISVLALLMYTLGNRISR